MKAITKLKDEARRHEQREEWDKAIDVYLQVLAADAAEGGDVELPLYNRIGDLMVRLGRQREAVQYYEQAADHYANAGLFNNAIALCNKALRYMPGRVEILRKLGHFSASQGFLTDARKYFLEYADKKFAAGDNDAALAALTDYASIAGDAEIRELLGRKLLVHGRQMDGVLELRRAYTLRLGAGEAEAAATLRREILAVQPDAFDDETAGGVVPLPPPVIMPPRAAQLPGLGEAQEPEPVPGGPTPGSELDVEAITSADLTGSDSGPGELLAGFESTAVDQVEFDAATVSNLAELEPAAEFDSALFVSMAAPEGLEEGLDAPPDVDAAAALPVLEGLDVPADTAPETAAPELPEANPELPALDVPIDYDIRLVGEDPEPDGLLAPPGEEAALPDLQADFDIPLLGAEGEGGELPVVVDLPVLAETPELPELEIVGFTEDVPALPEPDTPDLVEDDSPLPLLDEPDSPPAAPEAPAGAFVDLGALVAEDEEKARPDTRFRIEDLIPTGDEDDDFADLLAQFKQRVAMNVAPEDAAAHYDLGLAFKDMGLLDEAIGELQVALRAGDMRLKVYEELGLCFLLKKEYSIAEKVLRRAAELPHEDDLELLGVYYHLARAYEELGRPEQARDAYERVLALDINFGDVAERIQRL